jgi:hypothetical protein
VRMLHRDVKEVDTSHKFRRKGALRRSIGQERDIRWLEQRLVLTPTGWKKEKGRGTNF